MVPNRPIDANGFEINTLPATVVGTMAGSPVRFSLVAGDNLPGKTRASPDGADS